jgi:hypothetical protein
MGHRQIPPEAGKTSCHPNRSPVGSDQCRFGSFSGKDETCNPTGKPRKPGLFGLGGDAGSEGCQTGGGSPLDASEPGAEGRQVRWEFEGAGLLIGDCSNV